MRKNEYKLLKKINGDDTIFALFGDEHQCLTLERGITNWKTLQATIGYVELRHLTQNYKHKNEILSFCKTEIFENKNIVMPLEDLKLYG